jgi:hypothetical protein
MPHRIPEDIRSDIRTTAFFIGNGSLLPRGKEEDIGDYDIDYGYRELLQERPELYEKLFDVYINFARVWWVKRLHTTPNQRAAQWMLHTFDPNYHPSVAFADWELLGLADPPVIVDYFDAVRLFARELVRGYPSDDLLKDHDYQHYLWNAGSFVESFFAVFCNVLQIDEQNEPLNLEAAFQRTAQFIRHTIDSQYQPQPAFADWEVELV